MAWRIKSRTEINGQEKRNAKFSQTELPLQAIRLEMESFLSQLAKEWYREGKETPAAILLTVDVTPPMLPNLIQP